MSTIAPQHAPRDTDRAPEDTPPGARSLGKPGAEFRPRKPRGGFPGFEGHGSPGGFPGSEFQGHPPEPDRVDALLRELRVQGVDAVNRAPALPGLQAREGSSLENDPSRCATGLADLDTSLGGGFPRKGLSEIAGSISSGRTSLALSVLAQATAAGEWTGWIEIGDAFDPTSAAAAGVVLERVLWVRAPSPSKALAAGEQLLGAGGFGPILLDLSPDLATERPATSQVALSAWPRLRRRSAESDSALLVLSEVRSTGSFADLAVELRHTRPRFEGRPALFTGLRGEIRIVRQRRGGGVREISWQSDDGRLKSRAA